MRRYRIAIVAVLLQAILLGSLPVRADAFYSVYVNGVRVSGYPLIRDGVAYLPVNTLAQSLGVSIRWNSQLNIIKVNGKMVAASPLNEDGRLFLPVESIAQALNGSVEWDGRNQSIHVTTGSAVASAGSLEARSVPPGETAPVITPPPVSVARTPGFDLPRPGTGAVPPAVTYPPATPTYPPAGSQSNYGGGYSASTNPYAPPAQGPSYPPAQSSADMPVIHPSNAPPRLSPNLDMPPPGTEGSGTESMPPAEASTAYASSHVYVPKTAQNSVFAVTVTNIETVSSIKDFYHPRPGYRFVIVYLSQQNVSNEVQIYTGRFTLLDQNNGAHEYVEGLSNFWLVILRPYGINFGYLVFEMPNDAQPTRLALHSLNQAPLMLNL